MRHDPAFRRRFYAALGVDPAEEKLSLEAVQAAHRQLFNRTYDRIEKPDGTFVVVEKRSGDVVGAGWADNRPGREELEEPPG